MIPGKNDQLVFDASFMLHVLSRPFNHSIDLTDEPEIIFGGAYIQYLTALFKLQITYRPNTNILVFDDDVTGAFRQPKYKPNVISAKSYIIDDYLFVPKPHSSPVGVHHKYPHHVNQKLLTNLVENWGPTSGRNYFTLSEAAELLGVLVSMC
jgi:hypothetical protein